MNLPLHKGTDAWDIWEIPQNVPFYSINILRAFLFSPHWFQIFAPSPDVTWFALTTASSPRSPLLQTDHWLQHTCFITSLRQLLVPPALVLWNPTLLSIHGASYFRPLSFVSSFPASSVTPPITSQSIFLALLTARQLPNLIIWPTKSSSRGPLSCKVS